MQLERRNENMPDDFAYASLRPRKSAAALAEACPSAAASAALVFASAEPVVHRVYRSC